MNTSFPKFNLSWLNDTDPAQSFDPINVDCMRVEQSVSPEHGESWVEMLRVDAGITLFHACHDLVSAPRGQLVPLLEAEGVYPEMTFSAQVVQGGVLCHDEGSPAVRIVNKACTFSSARMVEPSGILARPVVTPIDSSSPARRVRASAWRRCASCPTPACARA